MPPAAVAIASLAVAGVGTAVSIAQNSKANSLAQQANAQQQQATTAQRQMNDLQAARQRRDAIRQARIAAANAEQTGESQGSAASSSAIGGQGSIQSQLGSNLSFLDQYNHLADQASIALGNASNLTFQEHSAERSASNYGQIASLGMTVFANSPNISAAAKSVFK
jgi:regulator of protease activity HflC (stomatin/prohibitin superfamily)